MSHAGLYWCRMCAEGHCHWTLPSCMAHHRCSSDKAWGGWVRCSGGWWGASFSFTLVLCWPCLRLDVRPERQRDCEHGSLQGPREVPTGTRPAPVYWHRPAPAPNRHRHRRYGTVEGCTHTVLRSDSYYYPHLDISLSYKPRPVDPSKTGALFAISII
jgi:hypothetical protein